MFRLRKTSVVVLATLGATLAMAGPAAAKGSPYVSFSLPGSASAGQTIGFTWSAANLPGGSSVAIQQPEGTARVWRTIIGLRGKSGSSALPARGLGAGVQYRIAAFNRRGVLLASWKRSINIFGTVSLATLEGQNATDESSYATATSSFTYLNKFGDSNQTENLLTVAAHDNSCRSVTIDFVNGDYWSSNWPNESSDSATVTVVQESWSPVSSTSPFNQPGSVTANLVVGQSWAVNAIMPNDNDGAQLYLDGSAQCDTRGDIVNY